jgi:rhamnose transport system ATP-binding protein
MPEQQLVEIARALGAGARLLIMDEPTASLTAREVELLLALVKELRSQGVAIIYITHRLEEVFQIADRVTVLRDGESAFSRGVKPATQSLQGQDTPLTKTQLVSMMVGREISMIFPPSESSPGAPVLQLKDFGCSQTGIHGVNLEMRAGEILGLAGLVGSGRTELARILFGITPADTGSMLLDGKPVRVDSPPAAINFGIAYVPEDRRRHGVFLQLPIAHNISASVLSRLFPGGWIRREKERDLADKYVRELSIKTPSAMTGAGNLSGGNQQKVALARWLATSPRLLILDEPTQGVDVGAKAEIHKLIRQFAAEGLCVLMISSELPEIIGMSDRIAVMRHGTVVQTFPGNSEPGKIITAALGEVTSE